LIIAIAMFVHARVTEEPYDHRTGAELWEAQYGKVN